MNLKLAKRLRRRARLLDCQSIDTVHTYSKKRGQSKCVVVWEFCQRGIYLDLKKQQTEKSYGNSNKT